MSNDNNNWLDKIDFYFESRESAWRQGRSDDKWLWQSALVLAIVGFAISFSGDQHQLFLTLNHFSNLIIPPAAWANITFIGDTLVALGIGLIFTVRYPKLALAILMAALIGTVLVHSSKHILDLPRPPAVLDKTLFTITGPAFKSNSMPSGHTATALTLVALLWRCVPNLKWRMTLLAIGLVIGWSRIAVGVHWPADVFIGAALGLFSSWCGLKLSDRWRMHRTAYGAICTILLVAAILLFDFDGDLPHTQMTAKILSIGILGYWLLSWGVLLTRSKWAFVSNRA